MAKAKKKKKKKRSSRSSGGGIGFVGFFHLMKGITGLVLSITVAGVFFYVVMQYSPEKPLGKPADPGAAYDEHAHAKKGVGGVIHNIGTAYREATIKATEVSSAVEENRRLRLENVNLRRWVETLRYSCAIDDSKGRSKTLARARLNTEAGVQLGRTLASIRYNPPAHLLPMQLYTLAISYLDGGEYEKAAVIMSFLTGMEDNKRFQNARDFLLSAVAWYRIDYFREATYFLKKTLKTPRKPEALPFHAQARLWLALIADRQGKPMESQFWMKQLVEYHPNAEETRWVNGGRMIKRAPSSNTQSKAVVRQKTPSELAQEKENAVKERHSEGKDHEGDKK